MFKRIKMENFRRHADKVVTFADGLNVIRAPNEGGKSTTIEAALYALFGASALRDPLANTVTWGKKETELKVELTIEVGNRLYNFRRSKGGAECEHEGGIVTGQKEVSAFAAEILGADAAAANRLMLANQNNLRGALEEGPKAIAQQIESLADFDLFDRILEAASAKLFTGSPALLESKVREAEEQLAAAEPTPPDTDGLTELIDINKCLVVKASGEVEALEPVIREVEAAIRDNENAQRMHDLMVGNLRKAEEQHATHVEQKQAAEAKANATVALDRLAGLKQQLADIEGAQRRASVFKELTALTYPVEFWEGSKESFEAEFESIRQKRDDNQTKVDQLAKTLFEQRTELNSLTKQLLTDTCPTCKRALDDSHAHEHNAGIREQIEGLKAKIEQGEADLAPLHTTGRAIFEDIEAMRAVAKVAAPFEAFATRHGEYLNVDFNFYPPRLTWKGLTPADTGNPQVLKDEIASIEAAKEEVDRAKARVEALTHTIAEDLDQVERVKQQLAECPAPGPIAVHRERLSDLNRQIADLRNDRAEAQSRVDTLTAELQAAEAAYKRDLERKADAEDRLAQARKDLDQLHFNNALLKKIRAARPLIADKLWASVLAAVSQMFTQMRGEASVVTKDKDGFAVNGAPITSLSGSTLDLLGLAIRVALVKTFLPNSSFLVLDEPGAAMDEGRVTQMLGFIASAGFTQTLLITHEEISEGFADHLITL